MLMRIINKKYNVRAVGGIEDHIDPIVSRKFKMHKVSCPSDYFGRFISDLKLPPKTSLEVDALWEAMKPHVDIWQGKKPMGVAAAIIYKASTKVVHKRTQADICKVANVSEVTLRQINRAIENLFSMLDSNL